VTLAGWGIFEKSFCIYRVFLTKLLYLKHKITDISSIDYKKA